VPFAIKGGVVYRQPWIRTWPRILVHRGNQHAAI